jgi:lauroyl/myristoyl acyltransferase
MLEFLLRGAPAVVAVAVGAVLAWLMISVDARVQKRLDEALPHLPEADRDQVTQTAVKESMRGLLSVAALYVVSVIALVMAPLLRI